MKYVHATKIHPGTDPYGRELTWVADETLDVMPGDIVLGEYGYSPAYLRVVRVTTKPEQRWNGPFKVIARHATPDEIAALNEWEAAKVLEGALRALLPKPVLFLKPKRAPRKPAAKKKPIAGAKKKLPAGAMNKTSRSARKKS